MCPRAGVSGPCTPLPAASTCRKSVPKSTHTNTSAACAVVDEARRAHLCRCVHHRPCLEVGEAESRCSCKDGDTFQHMMTMIMEAISKLQHQDQRRWLSGGCWHQRRCLRKSVAEQKASTSGEKTSLNTTAMRTRRRRTDCGEPRTCCRCPRQHVPHNAYVLQQISVCFACEGWRCGDCGSGLGRVSFFYIIK